MKVVRTILCNLLVVASENLDFRVADSWVGAIADAKESELIARVISLVKPELLLLY